MTTKHNIVLVPQHISEIIHEAAHQMQMAVRGLCGYGLFDTIEIDVPAAARPRTWADTAATQIRKQGIECWVSSVVRADGVKVWRVTL